MESDLVGVNAMDNRGTICFAFHRDDLPYAGTRHALLPVPPLYFEASPSPLIANFVPSGTITTTLGTVVTADASASYAGIQVLTDPTGAFSFLLRRPTASGTARLLAEEVSGASRGGAQQSYAQPAVRRFDFDGPANATAPASSASAAPTFSTRRAATAG
jgi:hypothetical protein